MSTDDKSYYFDNSACASKLVHGKKRSIKVWIVKTIKLFKLGLKVHDLLSEIETGCLTSILAFCYNNK
jgi:hypothetical protein